MNVSQSNTAFHIRNWSIGTKLAACFGLILLLTIWLSATSLFSLLSLQRTVDSALNQGLQIEAMGNQIQKEFSMARWQEQAFLLNWPDEGYENAANSYLIPHGDHVIRLRQTIVDLDNLTANSQDKALTEINANTQQLSDALEVYRNEFNSVVESIRNQEPDENVTTDKLENAALTIQLLALDIAAKGAKLADAELNSVDESVQQAWTSVIIVVIISVILSGLLAIILTRQINRPLRVLTNMAAEIEEGNLTARVEVNSADELGQLADSFNAMAARLNSLVNNLEQQVAERTAELSAVNQKLEQEVAERESAERKVEERWLYLKGVLDAAPDAIISLDAQQQIVEWNPGAEQLFGYSRQEVIGRNIDDLITNTDTREEAVSFSKITMNQEHLFHAETVRCRKDGSLVDVLLSAAPIRVEDENIGTMAIYTDITRRKQTEQALQQAKEVADTLRTAYLALTQSLDLDAICEKLLDYLGRLVPYDSATIFLLEADTRLVAHSVRGYERWTDPGLARAAAFEFELEANSSMYPVVITQKSNLVPDTTQDPYWVHVPGTEHTRSWLGVPMVVGGRVIGVCSLDSTQPHFFTQEHIKLAESLAVQSTFAIQNARLFAEEQRQRQMAESLHEVAAALNSSLDRDTVLAKIMKQLGRVIAYNGMGIFLQDGDDLVLAGGTGLTTSLIGHRIPLSGQDPAVRVFNEKQTIIIADVHSDPYWQILSSGGGNIRGWMGTPLLTGDDVIGTQLWTTSKLGFMGRKRQKFFKFSPTKPPLPSRTPVCTMKPTRPDKRPKPPARPKALFWPI